MVPNPGLATISNGKSICWRTKHYKNGEVIRIERMNEKGDVIASASLKNGGVFEGSFLDRDEKGRCIRHYKNGKLIRTERIEPKKQPEATK